MFCSLVYALYAVLNREKLLVPMLVYGRGPADMYVIISKLGEGNAPPPTPLTLDSSCFSSSSSSYQSNGNLSAKDEC